MQNNIQNIAIVGGGTAGWMTAAALAKVLPSNHCKITLIESDAIGTVGVGEATIPQIRTFNKIIGVNEAEFMKQCQGTFKLAIQFVDWQKKGTSYYHPFGPYGRPINNLDFQHYWLRKHFIEQSPETLESYSINASLCNNNKFLLPQNINNSPLSQIAYAYHFDASLYAKHLRGIAEAAGVSRIEGEVTRVKLSDKNGYIESVTLASNKEIKADFFIDASGFKGLLIDGALKVSYDDWSKQLPANKALAFATKQLKQIPPFTRSIAQRVGWQWQIPLQHRTGNGYVYSDSFISEDEAASTFCKNLELKEGEFSPKVISFQTGKRSEVWHKNCLSIGLSSGFLEPLESTSIHLVQSTISKFLGLLPRKNDFEAERRQFNKQVDDEYLSIRDFIILHYYANDRKEDEFWRYCKSMDIPETLKEKIHLYQETGRIQRPPNDLFGESSWLAVLNGQGITSKGYSPLADALTNEKMTAFMHSTETVIKKCAASAPSHADFIKKYCPH